MLFGNPCFSFSHLFFWLAVLKWMMLAFIVYMFLSLNWGRIRFCSLISIQLVQMCTVTTDWSKNLDRLGLTGRFDRCLKASYWDNNWKQISANESSSLAQVCVQRNIGCGNLANFMLLPRASLVRTTDHS